MGLPQYSITNIYLKQNTFKEIYYCEICFRYNFFRPQIKMSNDNKKQKRSAISLETKIIILDRLAKGEGSTAIGKHFNLGESTIRVIKKMKWQ